MSIEWNSIILGDSTHGIMTKTVHKTLPVGVGGIGGIGYQGYRGVGVRGPGGVRV